MPVQLHSKTAILILSVTILVSGLGFLMASAVTIALPVIQSSLGIDITDIQWIVNAYVLMLGSLILLSGALGDLFCAKKVFTAGTAVFTLGCALCGFAWNAGSLIAFRAVQGAGAALMVPGSLTVINRTFRPEERGRAIGLWAGVSGGIASLGPFIGGVLANISWRWVFLSMVPLGIVSVVMAIPYIPHLPGRTDARIDWLGAFLIFGSLGALSYSLITISERGFDSGLLIWLLTGTALAVAFIFQTLRGQYPLLPPKMFNRNVITANVATFFQYFAFQGVFFLLAFRLQQLHGYSSLDAGLALVPATVLITLLTGFSGGITDRYGPKQQMCFGPLLVTGAVTWWFFFSGGGFLVNILPGMLLLGIGMVMVIPPITKTALEVKETYSGAASGLNNGASRVAGLFAIALSGSLLALVYTSTLQHELKMQQVPNDIITYELEHADQLLAAPLPEKGDRVMIRRLREDAFIRGFRSAAGLLGAASLSAALVALWGLSTKKDIEGN
ncbi:MAG: MFS transporter [Fibrobacterota bacterium]